MLRSMYSAVSGLKTHQTRMDVIGNNIANVNTVALLHLLLFLFLKNNLLKKNFSVN